MPESDTPAKDPAHDVLAAEAFALPARDPSLTHGPVVLPDDPTGIAEPHDVLAAEEFAMPAGGKPPGEGTSLARRAGSVWPLALAFVVLVVVLLRARKGKRSPVQALSGPVSPLS
jgi:hypothetical protein